MKLFSLALDYDGTITRDDRLDPAVRDAIAHARTRGISSGTLKQLVTELARNRSRTLEAFVDRGDFSRWIKDVFGDHALAAELRDIEARDRSRVNPDTVAALIDAIRSRSDLPEEALAGVG